MFLLSVDTGERRRLTSPPAGQDVSPAFAPDGRTLAFARYGAGFTSDLYLLDLDEDLTPIGEPRRRTFTEATTTNPVFTPDGRDIVFSSGPIANRSLWRVPVSGSASPERLPFGERGLWPAISRQGNRLAYTAGDLNTNIYRVNLPMTDGATGPAVKLIASSRADSEAQYSADGNSIAFLSTRSGSYEIWKCDSDGSNPVQLTSLGALIGSPRWAPDGKSIAFTSNVEGAFDVYVVNASPTWSRNGKWIYFSSNRRAAGRPRRSPTRTSAAWARGRVTSRGPGVSATSDAMSCAVPAS